MGKFFLLTVFMLIAGLNTLAQSPSPAPAPESKVAGPLSIGIMADNSGSFRKVLDFLDKTVQQIATDLNNGDEAFLLRFIDKEKISILEDFTGDKELLKQASEGMFAEGGETAISEALMYAGKHLAENGKNERKLLILITDGDNKTDKKFHAETVKYLKDNKIAVYIIGITITMDSNIREAQKFMEKLSAETGGSLVTVERTTGSGEAAKLIMKAIHAPLKN